MKIKGVDLSYANNITIADAKAAGAEFAILRAGFTGWGWRTMSVDAKFEKYFAEARSLGFPVGAYWYSCANDAESGRKEAAFLYDKCLKGKLFQLPIFIDVEESRWQCGNKERVTDGILAFCEYLKEKGFIAGCYSSAFWYGYYIDVTRLGGIPLWLADWRSTSKPKTAYKFDIWQASEDFRIVGEKTDLDWMYTDLIRLVKDGGWNGYHKTGDIDGDGKVTSTDARLALRAAVKLENLNEIEKEAADVDHDGKVTSADAREIMNKAVKI